MRIVLYVAAAVLALWFLADVVLRLVRSRRGSGGGSLTGGLTEIQDRRRERRAPEEEPPGRR